MEQRIVSLPLAHDELFRGELAERIPYHRMHGKQYCLPSVTLYEEAEYEELQAASVLVDRIYWKALRFAQRHLPDSFLAERLGIPPSLLPAARIETPLHGISRQDWIVTKQGFKCIENNTDTPTGVPEAAFLGNAVVSRHTLLRSASARMDEALKEAFGGLIAYYRNAGIDGGIACTSYGWHTEDACNAEYVREMIRQLGHPVQFVPLDRLEIAENGGLYGNGERIGLLYRLYPLEYLIHDSDETSGVNVGEALMELAQHGRLGLMNPPQSAITQSKGFMALIWALYERNAESAEVLGSPLFTAEEAAAVQTYLLPTYYENTVFVRQGIPFVAKSYWGREGKGTTLYREDGTVEAEEWGLQESAGEEEEIKQYYASQPKVYQRLFPMEEVMVHTEDGPFHGCLLTGAYVIGGRFAGLLPRVGGKITGDMAFYCPAAIRESGKPIFRRNPS